MKILAALMRNDPIPYGIACYHILEIEEIETDIPEGILTPEKWKKRIREETGLYTMFFHVPTVSAWSLNIKFPKKVEEGLFPGGDTGPLIKYLQEGKTEIDNQG